MTFNRLRLTCFLFCLIFVHFFMVVSCVSDDVIPEESLLNMGGFNDMQGTEITEDNPIYKAMPDPSVPMFYLPLKCSACGATVEEAVELLRPIIKRHLVRRERAMQKGGGKTTRVALPNEAETIDAFEKLCNSLATQYGLEMKDYQPSLRFSKSYLAQRVNGKWMPSFLSSTCEELLDEMETELMSTIFIEAEKNYDEKGEEEKLKEKVRSIFCTQWEKSAQGCDDDGLPLGLKTDKTDEYDDL